MELYRSDPAGQGQIAMGNINQKHPALGINGGSPVTNDTVLIHLPFLEEDDFAIVDKTMRSTFLSGDGPECRLFEQEMANYLGVRHALYLNSATSALELAFRVKDFDPGSEVIVPDFTYTSTALGALYNNLAIRLVDVYADNGSIDVSKIEAAINAKTVAIAPVDYAGIPAEMDDINAIAKKHGLYVVHDTAQSIGSVYKGKKTGTLADVSTFSFHGTKNLTTGEGGALTTDDDTLAARVRILREKGTDKHSFLTDNITRGYYEYVDVGMSYVQSNVLGALGISQLRKLDLMNAKRHQIAKKYMQAFTEITEIDFLRITASSQHNWHLFGILVPPAEKYWIMDAIRAEGVIANVHYTPLHRNRYYAHLGNDADFPGAMTFFNRLLRLPIYPSLTEAQQDHVIQAVRKVFGVS
jgi:perosamine synthetase